MYVSPTRGTPAAQALALTEAQLAELCAELQAELRRLTPADASGAGSGAAPRALDAHSQVRMLLIIDALSRVRAGIYGMCGDCRSPIAYERLAAIPETKTCVNCSWSREVQHGV